MKRLRVEEEHPAWEGQLEGLGGSRFIARFTPQKSRPASLVPRVQLTLLSRFRARLGWTLWLAAAARLPAADPLWRRHARPALVHSLAGLDCVDQASGCCRHCFFGLVP